MNLPTRCMRALAISLAVLLASIDLTHGFTLNYELVRPSDLAAEESRFPEVRHELRRYIDEADFDVAPILPLQRAVAMPLSLTTEATAVETTTVENETENVTNIYVTTISDTSSDKVETTIIPTAQDSINITTNKELGGNVVDTTTKYNESDAATTLLFKDMKRGNYSTPTTTTIIPKEITTVITATEVTNNYREALANEEKNKTKDIDTNTSAPIISTTTALPNIVETLTEPHNTTEVTTESTANSTAKAEPAWRKYTKIDRKPVNITEDDVPHITERIGDSVNAHTTESRVSLEKVFDLAPDTLSLQELKTHLMDTTNSIQTKTDAAESHTKSVNSLIKENSKVTEINPTEMVSMRAGYLDHTKSLVETDVTTTVNGSGVANEIEMEGVAYEMDTHDEGEDTQNMTSHSQMVEDAMKEELLVEARLVDSIRFHSTTPSERPKTAEQNEITASSDKKQVDQATNQKQPEDLTVKPINYEKKTINLYAVSPNYKPLKKIDVQPMKPFMRDPDDNSWRNESLSSLGIVFKGKNSSKAFTEVLKNKTETVMSNLPEQEKTIEKVELRDRLEKIAEKRKSKKKKTDKFGNTEYTDYEENNSGDLHSSKEKPSDVSDFSLTSIAPPNLMKTVEWATKGSVLEEVMPDTATDKTKTNTETPRPTSHDYYDSKDDDADYATFPNIDILKSTPRPRVQWPVTQKILDNTQPIRQFLPDRQPTVQYFPPRPKALDENVNNYNDDNNIKQKFNIYGHTIQPNVNAEPMETYTEKNPGSYRTEKYVSNEIRNRVPNNVPNAIQTKNPPTQPIQHVEYRPVEMADNRGFVIRHYKDLLEQVIKDADYDRNVHPYPAPPAVIVDEGKTVKSEEYDYGQRKEELNRFVDNFNQNHERFKVDFPVVFNTSIVHGSESGKVLASSSAMFKRLYNGASHGESFSFSNRPFDPNCENVTVELSPAYELHYYVPEQEETGDHTMPYGYRT